MLNKKRVTHTRTGDKMEPQRADFQCLLSVHFASGFRYSTPGVARCHIVRSTQNQGVPMATLGNDLYMAWPNNDTGHWSVFFAKSIDGVKTLKTMMISAPNKGNLIDQNTQISASESKCTSPGGRIKQVY
jgi:hypothetical protein